MEMIKNTNSKDKLSNIYYVSPLGDNEYKGTIEAPFRTIQRAADIMLPGDKCFIREGTYREMIVPKNSGLAGKPICFEGYDKEEVIVTGCELVSNWTKHKDSIYKAEIYNEVLDVFTNGCQMNIASYPKLETQKLLLNKEHWMDLYVWKDKIDGCYAKLKNVHRPEDYWKGGKIIALSGRHWVSHYGKISTSKADKIFLENQPVNWLLNEEFYSGNGKGYIIGLLSELNAEKDWHWEDNKLYFWPPGSVDPSSMKIEARVREYAFYLEERSYINIKKINFVAANIALRDSSSCEIDSSNITYPVQFFSWDSGFVRDGAEGEDWVGKGVVLSGEGNIIKNSYVAHSWGDGISIYGSNNTVYNCFIEDCNWSGTDCAPITVTGTGHHILNNTMRKTARSGLVHRYLKNGKIKNNKIYNCGLLCGDMGLTYTYRTDGEGTEIAYNYLIGNPKGPGLYLDNHCENHVVHHNIIAHCLEGIRINIPSRNIGVFNNTIWDVTYGMVEWGPHAEGEDYIREVKTYNNISSINDFLGQDIQKNIKVEGDCFIDSTALDFRLNAGSKAIDFGLPIEGITEDFSGSSPDAGAFEFGGKEWTAGSTISLPMGVEEDSLSEIKMRVISQGSDNVKIVNENSNRQTINLMRYLFNLQANGGGKVISGVFSLEGLKEVYEATGEWAGLVGEEYCTGFGLRDCETGSETIKWKELNPGLIEHWKAGGIIRILTHFPNPTNVKYNGLRDKYANVDAILTNGTPERERWLALLDEVAAGFLDLEKEGVSVIYGPLHENQGDKDSDSFWWCISQPHMGIERYKALWIDIVDRMCNYNSCRNVIWLWSPLGFLPEEFTYLLHESYPGEKYVDLVGVDLYDDSLAPHTGNYKSIIQHAKPFMLGEFGPMKYYLKPEEQEPYDCRNLLKEIRDIWSRTIAFMFWYDQFLPSRHKFATEMMKDPMVINRGMLLFNK